MSTRLPVGVGLVLALMATPALGAPGILEVFGGSLVMGLISIVMILGAVLLLGSLIDRSLAGMLIRSLWLGMLLWETRRMLLTEEVAYTRLGGVLALLVVLSMAIVIVGAHLARRRRHRPLVKAWRQPLLDAVDQGISLAAQEANDAMAPALQRTLGDVRLHIAKARYYDGDHPRALLGYRQRLEALQRKAPYSALTRHVLALILAVDSRMPSSAPARQGTTPPRHDAPAPARPETHHREPTRA